LRPVTKMAARVAAGLGMTGKIKPAKAAVEPRRDLKKSKALSIMLNPPASFAGRKVGALVTDGVDAALVEALKAALHAEGALLELIAPTIGGVKTSNGEMLKADHKIGGAPSVLFDAVALIVSDQGVAALSKNAAVTEFVADAFGHLKFIAWVAQASALIKKAGVDQMDEGFVELTSPESATQFVKACRKMRLWDREAVVNF
jgi:catalase